MQMALPSVRHLSTTSAPLTHDIICMLHCSDNCGKIYGHKTLIFTMQCHASVVYAVIVCLSVHHKSMFY